MKSDGYYYINSSPGATGSISFSVTQPKRSVTYIYYSCLVNPNAVSDGYSVTNTATLGSYVKLFEGLSFYPYYSSDMVNENYKHSAEYIDGKNGINVDVGKKPYDDFVGMMSGPQAKVTLTSTYSGSNAEVEKDAFTAYDKTNYSKNL